VIDPDDASVDALAQDVEARLAKLCADWPPDEFHQLVREIAEIKSKYLKRRDPFDPNMIRAGLAGRLGAIPHAKRQSSVPPRTLPEM
jgi:hypothetical protein